MKTLYSLPDDILRLIFDFDSTYRDYFSQKIVPILPYFCLRKQEHLLFRAEEMMVNNDPNASRCWKIYDDSVELFEIVDDITSEYTLRFVNQNKISRFISLYMIDEDREQYSFCMNTINIEEYFIHCIQPLLLKHKHNHIVVNSENKEYYYHLNFQPYPRGLTTDKAFIYNDKDDEQLSAVVGIFDGKTPIFFKKPQGMKKIIKRAR
jgi:hypothetical protein